MENYFPKHPVKFSRFAFLFIGILMIFSGTLIASEGENQLAGLDENSNLLKQQIVVSGKVTDENNMALPGVNIVVEGTTIGTITNADGAYELTVPNSEAVLVFSYIGYATQQIAVGNQTTINITLAPDLTSIDEVVVIGYGESTRKVVTGAIVSLKEDEMTKGAATSSISSMLQGRAAGVEVSSNDGLPGQALNIVIRGSTSISNSNEPLYVIDGFPVPAGVSISPDDIASIDILKDAASAAIYGSRASAGVVLITTKRGSAGKTEISMDGYYGVQSMIGEVERLDFSEVARIANLNYAAGVNDGNPWYNAADLALGYNTDWLREATRQAPVQNYSLRASGGDDVSHFALSGNYFNQQGIFLKSDFERYSFRLNTDRKFGKRAKIGMNVYTSRITSDGTDRRPGSRTLNPLYAILRASPGKAAYNDDGTLAQTAFSRDTQPFKNPIGLFTERENDVLFWRTYGNVFIDFNILDNLVARLNSGFDHGTRTQSQYQTPEYSMMGSNMDWGQIDEIKTTSYLVEGTLNYRFKLLPDAHSLSLLAGGSMQYEDEFGFVADGTNFPTTKTLYYNLGSAENQTIGSYRSDQTIISFFGRASYDYQQKILLNLTLRADGASQFGENDKWGTFPSVSAAWRISEEEFLQSAGFLNDLKVRVSYGVTGNNGFSPYTSLARVGATGTYTFDGSTSTAGLGSDGIFAPNPDLKWESTRMFNVGLDFGLFQNRLFGAFEVYNSNTEDLIIDKPLSGPSTGYMYIRSNVGSMHNQGVELTLGGHIVTAQNFKWTINVNFSTNDNEITQLDGENPILQYIARQPYGEIGEHPYRQLIEGGKMGDFFGYTYRGVLQPGEVYSPQPNTTKAGSALYEDISGPEGVPDGIINSMDRSVIGNANPDFLYGINNHFEFHGLYLDMFWQGVVGNDVFNFKAIAHDQELTTRALDRYSTTNPTGTRPGVDWFANEYGSYVNTEFIEDATYLKLRNLTVGYNFDLRKVKWIQNLNIYVQGQNFVTITNYTGYDPDVSYNYGKGMSNDGSQNSVNRGVDDFGYPNYRTFTAGIKVTF
ncbi:MAG: TonB-dependent receptor [Bacteroidia bacterium]|nr:MAG: TonB-dependent receptor [Bacteroidia bacterium]